jgi:hypothetical protein
VSQALLADNFNDLVVQVATELDFHSFSRRQSKHLCEFSGITRYNWSYFFHSNISLSLFCAKAISCSGVFWVFFANAWKIKTESATFV